MRGRPAETAGGFGALATAVAYAAGAGPAWLAAIGIAAGLLPAALTFIVENGGLREVLARLWRGYRRDR